MVVWNTGTRIGGVGNGNSVCHSRCDGNSWWGMAAAFSLEPRQVEDHPDWHDYQSTSLCCCKQWWQRSTVISPGCPTYIPKQQRPVLCKSKEVGNSLSGCCSELLPLWAVSHLVPEFLSSTNYYLFLNTRL